MSDKNDVVLIELDRIREVRFGHKALKMLLALTGKDMDALAAGNDMDLEELEKILYCGLLSDARANNETLKLEEMEDLLDQASSFGEVMVKMQEAMEKAFGSMNAGNQPGNPQAQPTKQPRSTGSNR